MKNTNPPPESAPSADRILETALAFQASKTLLSAVEVGVFTELARKPADVHELRERLGLHPRGARDFFDALVALGFLRREDGVYHNTPESEAHLDRAKPGYGHVAPMLEMAGSRLFGIWNRLSDALRTGLSQDESKDRDEDTYDALYADPDRLRTFLSSMTGISHRANLRIARQVPWEDYTTMADMGTAQGDLAVQVLLANPGLSGTGFDLPQAEPVFTEYAERHGLTDRLGFTGGDFFTDPFPRADVLTFGHILHNWGLERKKVLLRKAWEALPQGGAVVVYDTLIDDDRSENAFALLMSLNMLAVTDGGFGYTGHECQEWMREAGFDRTWTEHLVGPDSIVVGVKE
ncbi:acetylserotonin O-methyltransferase [Streptomyces albidocamelliae]|uniref:Acetylserotonin O-methyltransferase n=1 Tax=Streptomyces albidocamelliae TaxID=2981135 RepID=A0ABY6EYS9_9ACTN|nr:acetylserotonin O-methyltransferase [Streptomyces sp. HUAS 14-6]UXY39534.1 acetylserotonin O-methyltransferase [Streptomyces sp. HUAS 14-6]